MGLECSDKLLTLLVGHLVVFYWRGTWMLIDFYSNWQPTIAFSLLVGFLLVPLRRVALHEYDFVFPLVSRAQDAAAPIAKGDIETALESGQTLENGGKKCVVTEGVKIREQTPPSPALQQPSLKLEEQEYKGAEPTKSLAYHWLVTYVSAFVTVNAWRGVWYALDECLGTTFESSVVSHVLATLLLLAGGRLSSAHAPPALVGHDLVWDAWRSKAKEGEARSS
jgi:hypothetical protein